MYAGNTKDVCSRMLTQRGKSTEIEYGCAVELCCRILHPMRVVMYGLFILKASDDATVYSRDSPQAPSCDEYCEKRCIELSSYMERDANVYGCSLRLKERVGDGMKRTLD